LVQEERRQLLSKLSEFREAFRLDEVAFLELVRLGAPVAAALLHCFSHFISFLLHF
jgi:hypothetical protein